MAGVAPGAEEVGGMVKWTLITAVTGPRGAELLKLFPITIWGPVGATSEKVAAGMAEGDELCLEIE